MEALEFTDEELFKLYDESSKLDNQINDLINLVHRKSDLLELQLSHVSGQEYEYSVVIDEALSWYNPEHFCEQLNFQRLWLKINNQMHPEYMEIVDQTDKLINTILENAATEDIVSETIAMAVFNEILRLTED